LFAKNASADITLRCNAFITVMQAAELPDLDDLSDPRDLPRSTSTCLMISARFMSKARAKGEGHSRHG
jgi:hypothetical protein